MRKLSTSSKKESEISIDKYVSQSITADIVGVCEEINARLLKQTLELSGCAKDFKRKDTPDTDRFTK